jgi:hypothetical protein
LASRSTDVTRSSRQVDQAIGAVTWLIVTRRIVALAVAALALTGCGAGASESEQVSSVVHRYFSSFARGSGTELCPLLTQSVQDKMVEVAESDERELRRSSTVRACPEAVKFLGGGTLFENAKVIAVSITGTNATVTVKVGSLHRGPVTLSKTAAGWLINKLPGEA